MNNFFKKGMAMAQEKFGSKVPAGVPGMPGALDIGAALKEALDMGVEVAVAAASEAGGFTDNATIKIPFPEKVQSIEEKLRAVPMNPFGDKLDDFVASLNAAAENAAGEAAAIFKEAITGMSIDDADSILKGGATAATDFLRESCQAAMKTAFTPIVEAKLGEVDVTEAWNSILESYNALPGVPDVEFDLDDYAVDKTIDGIMTLIAAKEADIRANPMGVDSELIQSVFGGDDAKADGGDAAATTTTTDSTDAAATDKAAK